MNTTTAEQLVKQLMTQHGVGHIPFEWSRKKQTLGYIKSKRVNGVITQQWLGLSKSFVELNSEAEVRDTILHEIAHLLAGVEQGHNHVWRAKCREIGAKPEAYATSATVTVAFTHAVVCRGCKIVFKKLFAPSRKDLTRCHCPECGPVTGRITCVKLTPKAAG